MYCDITQRIGDCPWCKEESHECIFLRDCLHKISFIPIEASKITNEKMGNWLRDRFDLRK